MTWRIGHRLRSHRISNLDRRLGFESLEERQLLSATSSIDPSSVHLLPAVVSHAPAPKSDIPETVTVLPAAGADQAVVVEPNGKIIVVHGDGLTTTMNVYNADGTPDVGFGSGGQVINVFGTYQNSMAAMALQSDGKIVVVGWVLDQNLKSSFAVVRYNSDGSLDTSFGNHGTVVTSVDQGDDLPTSLAIQPDGKIVVGGAAGASIPWNWNPSYPGFHPDFLIAPRYSPVLLRYNPDGSLDSTFNATGIDEFNYDGYPSNGYSSPYLPSPLPLRDAVSISQVQIQADGKIVVAAGSDISRINADGSLDTTFGQGGVVTVPLPVFPDAINDLVIQSDGKLLIETNSYATVNEFAIYISRYNANGSLDMTFNNGQPISTPEIPDGWGELTDLAVGSDGKIVAAATVNYVGAQSYGVIARYDSDGSLDTSFGETGQAFEQDYGWNAVAIQSDDKVVAVGGGVLGSDGVQATSEFHVKRFNVNGTEDGGFNSNIMTPVNPSGPASAPPDLAPSKVESPTMTVLNNTAMPLDVNGDHSISRGDLLLIVDTLKSPSTRPGAATEYLDVNDDGIVSSLDALILIDYLIDSINAPLVTSSGTSPSVTAKSVTNFVDNEPSMQVFSLDQTVTQLTGVQADHELTRSTPAPLSATSVTATSPPAATITLVAPDDVLAVVMASSDDDADDSGFNVPL